MRIENFFECCCIEHFGKQTRLKDAGDSNKVIAFSGGTFFHNLLKKN